MGQTKKQKIGQVEFIRNVAERSGLTRVEVRKVYDAMLEEILENVSKDIRVTFPNFGAFYASNHKGHYVQYGNRRIDDYVNLKFSATRKVNRILQTRRNEVMTKNKDCE